MYCSFGQITASLLTQATIQQNCSLAAWVFFPLVNKYIKHKNGWKGRKSVSSEDHLSLFLWEKKKPVVSVSSLGAFERTSPDFCQTFHKEDQCLYNKMSALLLRLLKAECPTLNRIYMSCPQAAPWCLLALFTLGWPLVFRFLSCLRQVY